VIIDFHTHVFPDVLSSPTLNRYVDVSKVESLRRQAKRWIKPWSSALHDAQTVVRKLPSPLRSIVDEFGALAPLPLLLIESTARDLDEAMRESGIDGAVIIAHPQVASNELILEAAERNPKLFPVVHVAPGTQRPGLALKKWVARGARALKIHTAADGEGRESPHYLALLKSAQELGLPVILHTGCFKSHLLYRNPDHGRVEEFEPWFRKFPEISFVLAHMNFHDPQKAVEMAEKYPRLFVDTSWQPKNVISKAVRTLGADRVLFATDWPFIGDNLKVGLLRIEEILAEKKITEEESKKILGLNASKLLKLPSSERDEAETQKKDETHASLS
jgi:predicted TIM-barrel fold metal-dependent hydrolase